MRKGVKNKYLKNEYKYFTFIFIKKDKAIYKKTDYLCNKKEKICICNIHADDLRKIYEGNNYDKPSKYISWYK